MRAARYRCGKHRPLVEISGGHMQRRGRFALGCLGLILAMVATSRPVAADPVDGDGNGGVVVTSRFPFAVVQLRGTNADFRIRINGIPFKVHTDSLKVDVLGRGSIVIDEHQNRDGVPRTTLNVVGAKSRVVNQGDDLATMNINDATTKLTAGTVSLFQGNGDVTLDGVGNTVLLGTGTFVDSAASAANTYLIGSGSSKVNGVAQVAMIQNPSPFALGATADLGFITGQDGQAVTGIGKSTNILATPAGATFLVDPPSSVDWDAFDGSLPPPDGTPTYALIDKGDGTFDFVDRADATAVTIGGKNGQFEIVADGRTFT